MPAMGGPKVPGPFVQDGPPKGGYKPVNYRRNIKPGGLSSIALMGGVCAMSAFGMYKVITANQQIRCAAAPPGGTAAAADARSVALALRVPAPPALTTPPPLWRAQQIQDGGAGHQPGHPALPDGRGGPPVRQPPPRPARPPLLVTPPPSPRAQHCTRPTRALCRSRRGAFIKSKQLENEAELMKDVPNWEVGASVYKTRWMPTMTLPGI